MRHKTLVGLNVVSALLLVSYGLAVYGLGAAWAASRQESGNTDPVIGLETQRRIAEWVNDPLTLIFALVVTGVMVALGILSSVRPVKDSSGSLITYFPAFTAAFVIVKPLALIVFLTHYFNVWGVGLALTAFVSTMFAVKYLLDLWMAPASPGSALSGAVPEPSSSTSPTPDRRLIEASA